MGGKLVTAKAKATGTNLCWGSTEKNRAGAGTRHPNADRRMEELQECRKLPTAELPEIGAQQFGCWIAKLLRLK